MKGGPSAGVGGLPQARDVDLVHREHRLHRPLGALGVRVAEQLGQRRRDDLPGQPEPVLEPAARALLAAVRGPFLLLQTAFCLGLSAAALTAAHEALQCVAEVFREELEEATAEHRRLRADLLRLAEAPRETAPRELFSLRLDAALLTGRATRIEAKVVGGRGYAMSSPTARRVREAAFLPVQSPTEGHLRWVLQNPA